MARRLVDLGNARNQASALAILVMSITVCLVGSYWLSLYAIHRASVNTVNVVQLCQSGNEARAEQRQLWNYIIAISQPPPHQTPAEKADHARRLLLFEAKLNKTFAPRDCTHIQ